MVLSEHENESPHFHGSVRARATLSIGAANAAKRSQQFSLWPLPPEGGTTNGRKPGGKPFVVPASAGPKDPFRAIMRIAENQSRKLDGNTAIRLACAYESHNESAG